MFLKISSISITHVDGIFTQQIMGLQETNFGFLLRNKIQFFYT